MIDHLEKNIHRYSMNDQDLLNDFFCDNIQKMNPKYNFQGVHFMYPDDIYYKVYGTYQYYSMEEIKEGEPIQESFIILGLLEIILGMKAATILSGMNT